jgi:hypothetical protein
VHHPRQLLRHGGEGHGVSPHATSLILELFSPAVPEWAFLLNAAAIDSVFVLQAMATRVEIILGVVNVAKKVIYKHKNNQEQS